MVSAESLIKPLTPGGRKPSGYSFLTKKCSKDERLRIVRYLSGFREAICEDLGGEQNLPAAKIVLIDRLVCLLAVCRGIEEHVAEDIITSTGSLHSCLGAHYLSYVNATRLILTTLGLEKQYPPEKGIQQIVAEFDAENAKAKGSTQEDAEQPS